MQIPPSIPDGPALVLTSAYGAILSHGFSICENMPLCNG